MLGKIISKLRMPDGLIGSWVIAVTVIVATFTKLQGGHLCTEAAMCL
jgi:hypothetical protein